MRLKVTFTGLCNFVPIFNGNQLESVWTLLVKATDPPTIPGGGHNDASGNPIIHAHQAYLRFPMKHLASAPEDAFGLWPLAGADLRFLDAEKEPITGSALTLAPAHSPHAFAWLADTGEGNQIHARVNPDCISADATAVPPDLVSSRLQIFHGTISTPSRVRNNPPLQPLRFWFEDPPQVGATPPAHAHALAEEALLEITGVPGNEILIERTKRDTPDQPQFLTLVPVPGDNGEPEISIAIMNLEPSAILEADDRGIKTEIEEFRWFYKLSSNLQPPFPRPVTDQGQGGNPFCPMSRSQA